MTDSVLVGLMGVLGGYQSTPVPQPHSVLQALCEMLPPGVRLDTARTYHPDPRVGLSLARLSSTGGIRVQEKVGAGLSTDLTASQRREQLQAEVRNLWDQYGDGLVSILLHRPQADTVQMDLDTLEALREARPEVSWGICAQSATTLTHALSRPWVQTVQLPLNVLDWHANQPWVKECARAGVTVQARSMLAGGLLTGEHTLASVQRMTDPIRRRYTASETATAVTQQRLQAVERFKQSVQQFNQDRPHSLRLTLAQAAVIAVRGLLKSEQVGFEPVLGGSCARHIQDGLDTLDMDDFPIPFLKEGMQQWAAPYI